MNREDILFRIKEILHNKLKIVANTDAVSEATDLVEDYHIDSMQIVSFIVELEDAFEVEIVSEELEEDTLTKMKNLIDYIQGLKG